MASSCGSAVPLSILRLRPVRLSRAALLKHGTARAPGRTKTHWVAAGHPPGALGTPALTCTSSIREGVGFELQLHLGWSRSEGQQITSIRVAGGGPRRFEVCAADAPLLACGPRPSVGHLPSGGTSAIPLGGASDPASTVPGSDVLLVICRGMYPASRAGRSTTSPWSGGSSRAPEISGSPRSAPCSLARSGWWLGRCGCWAGAHRERG
jgi:hypothetical protein